MKLLTLDEAAAQLRVSRRTVERRIDAGVLVVYRDGRRVAVPEPELRRYVAARTGRSQPIGLKAPSPPGRALTAGARLWD